MLTVVVPLASRSVVADWSETTRLLEGSLASILRQHDGTGIRAILVGHEKPPLPTDRRLEFIEAPFDPPAVASEPTGIRDKFLKLSIGFQRAGELSTTFAMRLDADDHISAELAGFVNASPRKAAWNLRSAYSYVPGRPYLHLFDDWVEHAVLNASVLQFPPPNHEPPDPHCLFTRWGHQQMTRALACREIPISPLPFPAACYVRHPRSLSSFRLQNRNRPKTPSPRQLVGRALRVRPLTKSIRAEFALD